MKRNVTNIQSSVRNKLQNKAKEINRQFSEVLQYYGMERFLYRLSCSQYADDFILKGALMFMVWQIPERRTTIDIDLLAYYDNKIETIANVIKDICTVPVDSDGLVFDPLTVKGQKIKEDADYEGVRVKFCGFLERSRIPMQIDIGFGDIIYPKSETIEYPVILTLKKPHLKVYPMESVVSEKFEAMVKLGLLNSRMKDFYDIWLLMHKFQFNESDIAQSIKRTFEHRKTPIPKAKPLFDEEIYDEKSDRQKLWESFLKKLNIKNAPEKLSEIAKEIENFLIKPIESINKQESSR